MLKVCDPPLHLVLVEPQIPPNTGNIARLCAVTGCKLILVEPLGFSISDRDLKRAGLDYWDKVFLKVFDSYQAYIAAFPEAPRTLFSARATESSYAQRYMPGHHLVFGSETKGLAAEILKDPHGSLAAIPMLVDRRSLNLSTAVGIAAYEALRQLGSV